MHPIPFYINIIISFSFIILQMTVIVSCGHWGNHLHWYSSIHPGDSQLIYCWVGYCSSFSDRMHKFIFHCLTSCLPCFSSVPCVQFGISSVPCVLFCFKLCTIYTPLFYVLHHGYSSVLSILSYNLILSICRLLSVNLIIRGDWCHLQKWQQWLHLLGLYPLS